MNLSSNPRITNFYNSDGVTICPFESCGWFEKLKEWYNNSMKVRG